MVGLQGVPKSKKLPEWKSLDLKILVEQWME